MIKADALPIELRAWPNASGADDIALVAVVDSTGVAMRALRDGMVWRSEPLGAPFATAPRAGAAVADLDGNGDAELIVVTQERVHVRNRSGAALRGWPRRPADEFFVSELFATEGPGSAPIVADVDGNGRKLHVDEVGNHIMFTYLQRIIETLVEDERGEVEFQGEWTEGPWEPEGFVEPGEPLDLENS